MKKILILSWAALYWQAHAGFYTGNELSSKLDEYESASTSAHTAYQSGMYAGYAAGAFDILTHSGTICPQGRVTTVQVNAIIAKYLRQHPELLNQDAGPLVRSALETAFPCGSNLPRR